MNKIISFFKFLWDPQKYPYPEDVPDLIPPALYNVRRANVLIQYLDAANKLVKRTVYFDGTVNLEFNYFNYTNYVEVIDAEKMLNRWLLGAMKFGVYDIGNRILIPRDRVLEMFVTYEDYEIEF